MIRIAVVGAGAISDAHLEAYRQHSDRCRVVALVDLQRRKALAKAAQHGLDLEVYTEVRELTGRGDFDAASVCLPPFAHASATVELLRAGKHVLVEKPMAPCLEECDAMLAAAASGRVLSVVAQNRFKTPMLRLKRVLESGLAGRIRHARVDSFWWRGDHYYDLWWRGTWEREGGGCVMNHAVHHIDLFHWFMGQPAEVLAVTRNLAHPNSEVEDYATAILQYPDGAVGHLTASLVHHGEDQRLTFQGEHAEVAVPWQVRASRQRENGFPDPDPERAAALDQFYQDSPAVPIEGHPGQIGNFLDAIDGKAPLWVDGRQGRATIELVSAIYQSAFGAQAVRLPLDPTAPFYTREGILRHARRFHQKTRSIQDFGSNEISLAGNYGR